MRIIDTQKRKDYYDCIQQWGQDRSIVWIRKPVELKKSEAPLLTKGLGSKYTDIGHFTGFAIGFCGKLYHGVKFTDTTKLHGNEYQTHCFYDIKSVDRFILKLDDNELLNKYYNQFQSKNFWGGRKKYSMSASYRSHIEDHLNNDYWYKNKIDKVRIAKKLLDNKLVTYLIDTENDTAVANTNQLGKWDFAKVFDPFRAFQEISMYVGGILATPIKPIPDIPDKVMAESKGFDKWSFRKESTK